MIVVTVAPRKRYLKRRRRAVAGTILTDLNTPDVAAALICALFEDVCPPSHSGHATSSRTADRESTHTDGAAESDQTLGSGPQSARDPACAHRRVHIDKNCRVCVGWMGGVSQHAFSVCVT